MSSTNRGGDRNASDYYRTPISEIQLFLREWHNDLLGDLRAYMDRRPESITWLDPCAGGDSKHPMSYPTALENYFGLTNIGTIDIREDSLAVLKADYLTTEIRKPFDVIISNPPFHLAQRFITKSLREVVSKGYVIYLLRLNYFGSVERFEWWKSHLPLLCYVHHRRMGFGKINKKGKEGTDSIEYAHFVWQQGVYPKFTQLRVI